MLWFVHVIYDSKIFIPHTTSEPSLWSRMRTCASPDSDGSVGCRTPSFLPSWQKSRTRMPRTPSAVAPGSAWSPSCLAYNTPGEKEYHNVIWSRYLHFLKITTVTHICHKTKINPDNIVVPSMGPSKAIKLTLTISKVKVKLWYHDNGLSLSHTTIKFFFSKMNALLVFLRRYNMT